MTPQQQALRLFLNEKADTLYAPAFNPWGGNRAYFKKHGIDPLWDLVADPTRYPFDLGYRWGVFKVIRGANLGEYFTLLAEAVGEN